MGDLPACWMGPGARGYPALEAYFHQLMICRVKLDLVDAFALRVERLEARRVFIRLPAKLPGLQRPDRFAESVEMGHMAACSVGLIAVCVTPCIGRHERLSQGRILQKIKIARRSWLIGDLVCREFGSGFVHGIQNSKFGARRRSTICPALRFLLGRCVKRDRSRGGQRDTAFLDI